MRFVDDTQKIGKDANATGPRVLAAGLWRCTTSSLQTAFEDQLHLAPSMHGAYIMPSIGLMKLCCDACRETDTSRRRLMLYQLFDGYNASSDFPGMAFVDDLLEMYPDVKVVLNTRSSAEAWEASVRTSLRFYSTRTYLLLTCLVPQSYWHHQIYQAYTDLARRRHGVDDIFTVELYEKHNQWVRDVVEAKGKKLLEWEPSQGWEPLCDFIEEDVPEDEFPNINEGQAIKDLTRFLVIRGLKAWSLALIAPTVLTAFVIWRRSAR